MKNAYMLDFEVNLKKKSIMVHSVLVHIAKN